MTRVVFRRKPPKRPPTSAVLLATLTLLNTSGSSQSTNFHPQFLGLTFKKGDIPAGGFPKFELTDGTNIAWSWWNQTYWPDGSLLQAGFDMLIPVSVAGSGTLSINVKSGGSAPGAGPFSASTITANTDFKVVATGQKNIAASTWTSALNSAAAGDTLEYADGPTCYYARWYQEFNDGSSDHAQAGCWHYAAALKDSAGGIFGYRYIGKLANGWHDIVSPALDHLVFKDMSLKNGAGTIRSIASTISAFTFSWVSGSTYSCTSTTGLIDKLPVYLTTTGSLPTPNLSTTTAYFIRVINGTQFSLHPTMNDVEFSANAVASTGAGSPTNTVNPTPVLQAYCNGPFTVGTENVMDFVAGTGAETTCIWQHDKAYLKSTGLLGPIDATVSGTAVTARSYGIDSFFDYHPFENTTGEREEIGWMPAWSLRHFLRQDADSLKTARCHALQMHQHCWSLRRSTTRNILSPTNTTYTGLGTALPTYIYYPANHAADSGANEPADIAWLYSNSNWSHKPNPCAYAYMITGEMQYLDYLQDAGVGAIAAEPNTRTFTVASGPGAGTYYTVFMRDAEQRQAAWSIRDVAWAAAFTPTSYNGSQARQMFLDCLTSNFDCLKAEKLTGTAFAQSIGIYPTVGTGNNDLSVASWQMAYLLTAFLIAYTVTEDADAKLAIEDQLTFWNGIKANQGLYYISAYYTSILPAGVVGSSKNVASWNDVLNTEAWDDISWNSGTDLCTATNMAGSGTRATDDTIAFAGTTPTPLTQHRVYFIRDISGNDFKLASTAGGAALDLTNTGSEGIHLQVGAGHPGASSTDMAVPTGTSSGADSYRIEVRGAVNWAQAKGCTVPSGLQSAVETANTPLPSFADKPTYAMNGSF